MQNIEDKIRNNLDTFNSEEPESGHFEKFSDRLDRFHADRHEGWFERHDLFLKIAATVIVFAGITTLLYTGALSGLKSIISDKIVAAELPVEIKEVMQYYNVITDKKVEEIDDLAVNAEEAKRVKEMALFELSKLEKEKQELEKEYAKNPGNDRITDALVLNQQKKSRIMDKILNTLNQVN